MEKFSVEFTAEEMLVVLQGMDVLAMPGFQATDAIRDSIRKKLRNTQPVQAGALEKITSGKIDLESAHPVTGEPVDNSILISQVLAGTRIAQRHSVVCLPHGYAIVKVAALEAAGEGE